LPNRIIKESFRFSEKINRLTDFQFRLWVSLITYVDDYGRGDARPAIIRGACFPLRERLSNADLDAALNALAGTGCVELYQVDGRPYLCFPNWQSHQRVRNSRQIFPSPEQGESGSPPRPAATCGDLPRPAATCRDLRPESNPIRIQSESESESKGDARAARFTPPTVEAVASYCLERKNRVNAQRFVDFYASKGWMVGKSPMKDWKAAVRNWEREDGPAAPSCAKPAVDSTLIEAFMREG